MNEEFVLAFARQRMQQYGISCYHFEPLYLVVTDDDNVQFQLYNEWWFLVGIPDAIEIRSDSAYFNGNSADLNRSNVPEFTGSVSLRVTNEKDSVQLLFIRVIVQHA